MRNQAQPSVDQSRREAIAKLGAFAAFTSPVVTTLLLSNKATAQSHTVTFGGGPVPGTVTVNPDDGSVEGCVGGNDTCP